MGSNGLVRSRLFLGSHLGVVRDRLHFGLVYHFGTFDGEVCAGRNDPVLSTLGAQVPGASFDAAGINSLLRFSAREIGLAVDGAFACQVPAFLRSLLIANN